MTYPTHPFKQYAHLPLFKFNQSVHYIVLKYSSRIEANVKSDFSFRHFSPAVNTPDFQHNRSFDSSSPTSKRFSFESERVKLTKDFYATVRISDIIPILSVIKLVKH